MLDFIYLSQKNYGYLWVYYVCGISKYQQIFPLTYLLPTALIKIYKGVGGYCIFLA